MSKERLTALASYRRLPPELQSLVRLALLRGLDGPETAADLGLPNPSRVWESSRVQAVVKDYGSNVDDILAAKDAPGEGRTAPVAAQSPNPMQEPTPPCACGKVSSGQYGNQWMCPLCMITALGIKPDGTPIPPEPPAPAAIGPFLLREQILGPRFGPAPPAAPVSTALSLDDLLNAHHGKASSANIAAWQQQAQDEQDERHHLITEYLANR